MGVGLKIFAIFLVIWGTTKFAISFEFGDPCEKNACFPYRGNLATGRTKNFRASSTCGLTAPEHYNIFRRIYNANSTYISRSLCDSRLKQKENPMYVNHRIENIAREDKYSMYVFGSLGSWWQSKNGVQNVTLQFDLEEQFDVDMVVLTFKSSRPKAMYIEKSIDFGKTWTAVKYFAENCSEIFPGIQVEPALRISDVICTEQYSSSKYSSSSPPYAQEDVIHRAVPPYIKIVDPYVEGVQNILKTTNLRFQFVKLHTFDGEHPNGDNKDLYYYAVRNIFIRGSCSCNGHAARCVPKDDGINARKEKPVYMIHPKCECKHNTKGMHCQLCDGKFDLPWAPARNRKDVNMCKNIS